MSFFVNFIDNSNRSVKWFEDDDEEDRTSAHWQTSRLHSGSRRNEDSIVSRSTTFYISKFDRKSHFFRSTKDISTMKASDRSVDNDSDMYENLHRDYEIVVRSSNTKSHVRFNKWRRATLERHTCSLKIYKVYVSIVDDERQYWRREYKHEKRRWDNHFIRCIIEVFISYFIEQWQYASVKHIFIFSLFCIHFVYINALRTFWARARVCEVQRVCDDEDQRSIDKFVEQESQDIWVTATTTNLREFYTTRIVRLRKSRKFVINIKKIYTNDVWQSVYIDDEKKKKRNRETSARQIISSTICWDRLRRLEEHVNEVYYVIRRWIWSFQKICFRFRITHESAWEACEKSHEMILFCI